MKTDFGRLSNRCLFCNHCLEAHLVGLSTSQPEYQDCLAKPITLWVTSGIVELETPQENKTFHEGESTHLPAPPPFHIRSKHSADLMLLMGTRSAA
tara:strand:+ start:229 stop:516 length:288 start_codon:yes stop_codon:yes gene_type:complete